MNVELAYGRGVIPVDLPGDCTTVIEPAERDGLPDERAAVLDALVDPIGSRPLLDQIRPTDRVCILFTDITRATPNERIIPWLLEHLGDHPRENIVLLNQLGTHRPNTREELEEMLGVRWWADAEMRAWEVSDESRNLVLQTPGPGEFLVHGVTVDSRGAESGFSVRLIAE